MAIAAGIASGASFVTQGVETSAADALVGKDASRAAIVVTTDAPALLIAPADITRAKTFFLP